MILKFDEFATIQGSPVATFFDSVDFVYYFTSLEDFGFLLRTGAFTYTNNLFKVNDVAVEAKGVFNGYTRLIAANLV